MTDNIFAELAKVKSKSAPVKLEVEEDDSAADTDAVSETEEGQLTVDVYERNGNFVVQSAVAGVEPENLDINITNESVTIKGKRERTEKVEEKDFLYKECFWGGFSRSIILPEEIDPEKSTASLKNGVLTITMPKLVRKKSKQLKVKVE